MRRTLFLLALSPLSALSASLAAPIPGRAILKGDTFSASGITVYVNGQRVGHYASPAERDIYRFEADPTRLLKVGTNTLRVVWTRPQVSSVKIAHAAPGQDYRDLVSVDLDVSNTGAPGEKTLTFQVLPAGSKARAGSGQTQTVVKARTYSGSFTVYLNGQEVGGFQGTFAEPLDISDFVKKGENLLRVVWKTPGDTTITVAHAAQKNAFRNLARLEVTHANGLGSRAGEKTIRFTLP